MNYPTFLNQVDQLASACDADSLRQFVHGLARVLPEYNREHFLAELQKYTGAFMGENPALKEEDALSEQVDALFKAMEKIQDGSVELQAEYNEEWDDWYNPDANEILFSDPERLIPDIMMLGSKKPLPAQQLRQLHCILPP